MNNINEKLSFVVNLAKTHSVLVKRFESGLGNGLTLNEFLILFYLDQVEDKKLRRIDLAEKVGVTASGITRMLLPMEKIGLIKSDVQAKDARVKSVIISKSGQEKIDQTIERLNDLIEEMFSPIEDSKIKELSGILIEMGGRMLMS